MSTPVDPRPRRTPWPVRWWPVALGLTVATAALLAGADADAAATCVGVAALCYLAAAALGRPWLAWAGVAGGSVLVVLGELAGIGRWTTLGGAGAALLTVALVVGVPRRTLLAEALAFVAYGGVAVAALTTAPRAAAVVAGLALAAHAAWDARHLRRGTVVPRSLAKACLALDLPLGLGVALVGLVA